MYPCVSLQSPARLRFALTFSLCCLPWLAASGAEAGVTFFVSPCGNNANTGLTPACFMMNGPKATIQAALAVADDGSTIVVFPGTYSGPLDLDGKAVTLVSNGGADVTIITGNGATRCLICNGGEGPDTVIEGFTITDGKVNGGSGGGMFASLSSPTITDCIFADNQAGQAGGGLFMIASASTVSGCTFVGNFASATGGGAAILGGSPTFMDCTFESNAAELGGGLANSPGSAASIVKCAFIENFAFGLQPNTGFGGAMYNELSSPTIDSCEFTSNECGADGGGMYNDEAIPEILGCQFTNNDANANGGGLASAGGAPFIAGCTFLGNSAFNGGGIDCRQGSAPHVTSSLFTDNFATNVGGGASVTGTAEGTHFANTTFILNSTSGGGGAMAFGIGSRASVVQCNFNSNHAGNQDGGVAGFGQGSDPLIVNCDFVANSTDGRGGGAATCCLGEITIVNGHFSGNSAPAALGGAIGTDDNTSSTLTLVNATVSDNAGGGLLVTDAATVTVLNSIIWANAGPEIIGSPALVGHSDVQGGFAGPGNINLNPQFANPAIGNYRLSAISPCIDRGANFAVPLDAADVDSDRNVDELTPRDLEDESRFVNTPDSPNFGCAAPGTPIVDMGAYEFGGGQNPPVLADLNGDGIVDGADLGLLLLGWGPCAKDCCLPDMNFDGEVDGADLGLLLLAWS